MNNSKNGKINPDYYKSKIPGIECIDVVKYLDFPIGNAIKYLWRAGNKSYDNLDAKASAISKLEKAIWYINCEINKISESKNVINIFEGELNSVDVEESNEISND